MSKISTRLGAAVALAAGASMLASGVASAAPQTHPDTKPSTTTAEQSDTSAVDNTANCIEMGKTKDAFFSMQGVKLDYPLVGAKRDAVHDVVVEPICAAFTYGPFSAYKGQQAPTNVTINNPAPDGQQKPDPKPDPVFPPNGPVQGHLGAPQFDPQTSNPFAGGGQAAQNPLGGLLPGPGSGAGIL